MNSHFRPFKTSLFAVLSILLTASLISSCAGTSVLATEAADVFTESVENYPKAEVVFQVTLPSPILEDEKIVLEILDDVTGIYINPDQHEMASQDLTNFYIKLPLTVGEKIKYRYLRRGVQDIYEYTAKNKAVEYRLYYVNGPAMLQDSVSAWADLPYSGPIGRIRGQLIDNADNSPIPNMLVSIGGMHTLSASDGSFILEGLPLGTQNVVISSLDGAYETFQQGAVIAEESTTPIFISLQKRETVTAYITVRLPDGFSTNLPLRLATNLHSLGYPEAVIETGSNTVSADLPTFTQVTSNEYSLSIDLPAGADLRYKFTLGDGFWNSELSSEGYFVTRELIVPSGSFFVEKKIATFSSPNVGAITFNIAVPDTTPANEFISLQLNSFGWMQPLPMVKTGENQWTYTLYSPTNLIGEFQYRFCRNDQCDEAASLSDQTNTITPNNLPQTLALSFQGWENLAKSSSVTSVDTNGGGLLPRTDFITGFELSNDFPTFGWQSSVNQGLSNIYNTGANWVILSPTWTATYTNPPLFEPAVGSDLLWPDLQSLVSKVSQNGLQAVLFPQISSEGLNDFWINGKKDEGWWQSLFERYHRFMIQNADLANVMNAGAILIGDPGMRPAMSGGLLVNGASSDVPDDADEQWSQLIQDIRARYSGPVIGVISVPDQYTALPGWLKDVDAIYVLFSPALNVGSDQSVQAYVQSFNAALDTFVQPIATQYNKPILIGINYPATSNAINGCTMLNGSCLSYDLTSLSNEAVDPDTQAKIYNAAIISAANRSWINGFISRGFNPLVVTKDQSSSINGKPASDVLWFWFHYLLNKS